MSLKHLIEPLVMPPLAPLLLIAGGLWLQRRKTRGGKALIAVGMGLFVLLSQPFVGAALLISLQTDPPLPAQGPLPEADAIVILGADLDPGTPELGGPSAGPLSLLRVRYGALLAQRSGLPVLVTGGPPEAGRESVAKLMADALKAYGVKARWREGRAADTRQNARFSAAILERAGLHRVLLVSHAWHLPRARAAFEAAGLEVIAAPTVPRTWPDPLRLDAYIPSVRALRESRFGLHEWLGRAWYALTR